MGKKTIVVVGAGKGMGNHIAKAFAKHDFRVVLIARRQDALDGYAKEFAAEGYECHGIAADASDVSSLDAAFSRIESSFGVVDVLVYNAAILTPGMPTSLTNDDMLHHFQVDVASALHCAELVVPGQKKAGAGTILFTGGGLALHPIAQVASISINKAALRTLALTLHQELAPEGIFAGTITITGIVGSNEHFQPEQIAEAYWKLYTDRSDPEIIY